MTPLPFTPFEEYLFYLDSPEHPCWMIAKFRWRGRFQRAPLERAWAATVARHPLLRAAMRRGCGGRLRWEFPEASAPAVKWQRREHGAEWPVWAPVDPEKEPSSSLVVVEDGEMSDVIFSGHHARGDGLAGLVLAEDIFIHYARELGESIEPKPVATEQALRRRNRLGSSWWEGFLLLPVQLAGLLASAGLLRREVAALIPAGGGYSPGGPPAEFPAVASLTLSGEESMQLREAAKRARVGMNELIMRDFQAAIGAWRLGQGVDRPQDWIRLGMPVNLRRRTGERVPVANIVSLVVIDRRAKSLANRERLLRRAREDMTLIEHRHFGYMFWVLLRLRRWWPGGIRAYARRPVCRATSVLTYVGKIFAGSRLFDRSQRLAVPGAILEEVALLAPTQPGTNACMDIWLYGGSFCATLNYDPRVLTRAQAEAFVDEFRGQLTRSMREPG